jgi:hypothetical protein
MSGWWLGGKPLRTQRKEEKKFSHRFSQIDEEVKSWNPTTRGKKQGDN